MIAMKKLAIAIVLGAIVLGSCNKLTEFGPTNDSVVLAENALETPEDLQALLNSCYDVIANAYDGRTQNLGELISDNLDNPKNNLDFQTVYARNTSTITSATGGVYREFYYAIYRANAMIQNFDLITGLTEAERKRTEAEARFLRGVGHWEEVKLFAHPYGYSAENSHDGVVLRLEAGQDPLLRSTVGEVYDSVIEDLNHAYSNLPEENGVYASKYSAAGYLAKVFFLMNNYSSAKLYSERAMEGNFVLDTLLARYSPDVLSSEGIFSTISFSQDSRVENLSGNYRSDNTNEPQLTIHPTAWSQMFTDGQDLRDSIYYEFRPESNKYVVKKFDNQSFNQDIVSLTEIMLIHAESCAELGEDLATAISEINAVRSRAYGNDIFNLNESAFAEQIIAAAQLERRKEFIGEGKWIDDLYRRAVKGEDISIRGGSWDCPGMALQIPLGENTVLGFQFNEEGGCN